MTWVCGKWGFVCRIWVPLTISDSCPRFDLLTVWVSSQFLVYLPRWKTWIHAARHVSQIIQTFHLPHSQPITSVCCRRLHILWCVRCQRINPGLYVCKESSLPLSHAISPLLLQLYIYSTLSSWTMSWSWDLKGSSFCEWIMKAHTYTLVNSDTLILVVCVPGLTRPWDYTKLSLLMPLHRANLH